MGGVLLTADRGRAESLSDALPAVRHVAFAGDWHADPNAAIHAIDKARLQGAELLVHVGNIVGTGQRFHAMTRAMEAASLRRSLPVIFIRGNRDDPAMLDALPGVPGTALRQAADGVYFAPDGASWTAGGRTFAALGGAASADRAARTDGVDWWPNEMPSATAIRTIVATVPRLDVLVSHEAPLTDKLAARLPRRPAWWDHGYVEESGRLISNAMWATAPQMLVCGNVHLRHSETVQRMAATTRVEVLDQGNGHGIGALTDNVITIDLHDKLLR